jgi:hypothetical protein
VALAYLRPRRPAPRDGAAVGAGAGIDGAAP